MKRSVISRVLPMTFTNTTYFYGFANRKKSEKWGCWIWLRSDFHNMSNHGIHADPELDMKVKIETQKKFEELYGHDLFMKEFGRSYL